MTPGPSRMPAIFFGHGNPMNALEQNRYTEAWRQLGNGLPRPTAILAVSAHWTTRGTAVTAMSQPRTIHDFSGFPRELYQVSYPAPGDPALAARVCGLLAPAAVDMDQTRGLDHGTWSVLAHVYPQADVPVVQLSLDSTRPPQYHYDLAARLAPLRDEGVLIVGSGNVVHNLGMIRWAEDAPAYDWAVRFNERMRTRLVAREHAPLIGLPSPGEAPDRPSAADNPCLDPTRGDARLSVPTPEHYLPLLYVIAQQRADETVTFPVDGIEHGSIGMLSVLVGP